LSVLSRDTFVRRQIVVRDRVLEPFLVSRHRALHAADVPCRDAIPSAARVDYSGRRMSVLRRQRPGWEFPTAVRGEGAYIWDDKGRRFLDAAGGAIVVGVGHGVVEIAEAIADQARRLAYVHGSELTSEPVEALAVELAKRVPVDDARLFLVSGGSEATETAIKLARQHHVARGEASRWKIVSRWPSYHGASLGALAVSGRPTMRHDFAPLLQDMPHIGAPYPYRCALAGCGTVCSLECARPLDATLRA